MSETAALPERWKIGIEGRALLIDLIALRHVVQPEDGITARPGPRLAWRPLAAAAAMLVALAGGYVIGERQSSAAIDEPPAPTRVVETTEWQTVPGGGGR